MVRALQAVDEADVALLVIDATEGITHQDQRLAERVDGAGCPIVVLLNKWELLDAEAAGRGALPGRPEAPLPRRQPVLRISALTGKGVHRLLPALADAIEAYHTRVPTRQVNDVVRRAQPAQPAPHGGPGPLRHPGRIRSAHVHPVHQQGDSPSYLRYIERQLSEAFKLGATPLKLRVRLPGPLKLAVGSRRLRRSTMPTNFRRTTGTVLRRTERQPAPDRLFERRLLQHRGCDGDDRGGRHDAPRSWPRRSRSGASRRSRCRPLLRPS